MKQAKLMAFVLAIPIVQLAQFPFPIPRIPSIPIRIPSLENLLKEEPPITSNIKDARSEVPFLDDFNPQQGVLMTLLSRSSQGGFRVQPGLFELNAQSYCLHAGSYRPGQGDGYVYAPLQGSRVSIIRHILQKSVDRPEIPQQDIQVLLWAIIARTKIGDMSESSQQVARMLLTKEEISQLNGGALGLIPDILKQQLLANLPESVRQVLEVENHLRQVLTQANASFEQLERIAVLVGNPAPDKNSREVPSGRWSYHPDGYFVRYQPSGYSQTQIQLYVPERFQIQRDERDRITSIAGARGERIEIAYDDTIAPVTI